jgi:hypothetical protein
MNTFNKVLSANDVGANGAHQAGILIPKTNKNLLEFLPKLDISLKNPDAWIICTDVDGVHRKFRFIYYNNKMHDVGGTRNEFRITHMTTFFKDFGAQEGDTFEISRIDNQTNYQIKIIPQTVNQEADVFRIKIKTGWFRVD